jgi:macrophage erythroblast attacher
MIGNPTKLIADNQLILDAPLLKVPLELIRRNFKSAQRNIDKETKAITASLNEASKKAQLGTATSEDTIASIDIMIGRMHSLKRKVSPGSEP